jgi:hypothetical protein
MPEVSSVHLPQVVPASGVSTPPVPIPPVNEAPKSSSPALPDVGAQLPVAPMGSGFVQPPQPVPRQPVNPVIPNDPPATSFRPTPAAIVPVSSVSTSASKFRIVLRVGEGEPTFEVRSGDDLLLKVICEKVDIKSPEKGPGPSIVKASGKVRFTGFGAEGTCDELAFLAGTGEVDMTGSVKIHVKDKLGRVESELSTETMKYKIDPSATGSLKP